MYNAFINHYVKNLSELFLVKEVLLEDFLNYLVIM